MLSLALALRLACIRWFVAHGSRVPKVPA
jgi:hypothetical protein